MFEVKDYYAKVCCSGNLKICNDTWDKLTASTKKGSGKRKSQPSMKMRAVFYYHYNIIEKSNRPLNVGSNILFLKIIHQILLKTVPIN